MDSPYIRGLKIHRDHDNFRKVMMGGSIKAHKWWFDEVELEPGNVNTYHEIQGIDFDIRHAHNSIAVIIDINNKTVKRIQGIPNTDPHSCSIDLYDGKVYFAAYGVNASGIFAYDPSNEAVEHVQECNTDISYLKIF